MLLPCSFYFLQLILFSVFFFISFTNFVSFHSHFSSRIIPSSRMLPILDVQIRSTRTIASFLPFFFRWVLPFFSSILRSILYPVLQLALASAVWARHWVDEVCWEKGGKGIGQCKFCIGVWCGKTKTASKFRDEADAPYHSKGKINPTAWIRLTAGF